MRSLRHLHNTEQYVTEQYVTEQYVTEQYVTEQYVTEQYVGMSVHNQKWYCYSICLFGLKNCFYLY